MEAFGSRRGSENRDLGNFRLAARRQMPENQRVARGDSLLDEISIRSDACILANAVPDRSVPPFEVGGPRGRHFGLAIVIRRPTTGGGDERKGNDRCAKFHGALQRIEGGYTARSKKSTNQYNRRTPIIDGSNVLHRW